MRWTDSNQESRYEDDRFIVSVKKTISIPLPDWFAVWHVWVWDKKRGFYVGLDNQETKTFVEANGKRKAKHSAEEIVRQAYLV